MKFSKLFKFEKIKMDNFEMIEYIKTEIDTNWRQDLQLNDTQKNDIHSNGINIDC